MIALIYIIKHSREQMSNIAHDMSKYMDEANIIHSNILLCKTQYVIETENYCDQMKP